MTQKPTAQIKKAVPQIKKRGLLSYNGEKDDEVIQLNTPELGLLQHLLQNKGRVNPKTGILSFAEGGGPGSGSHDSNHDSGGGMGGGTGGGSSRGGTGTTANGGGLASPEGGGGSVSGKGNPSNDHSSGPGSTGTTARGGMQSSPESAGGSINGPGLGNGPSSDPTSTLGMLGLAVKNFFSPTWGQRALSLATMGLPGPIGPAVSAVSSLGMAMGQKSKEVLDGIHNGTIDGTTSIDANGTEVGHVAGAQYGGTASGHGGNSGIGGGGGDPAYFNQQQQQNALNASTGIPGQIQAPPAGIPSLGLLGQFQQPQQQWTVPGYGFQTPGYGYLQWGQK